MARKYKLSRKKRAKIKGGATDSARAEHEAEYEQDIEAHEAGQLTDEEHFTDFDNHDSYMGGQGGQ